MCRRPLGSVDGAEVSLSRQEIEWFPVIFVSENVSGHLVVFFWFFVFGTGVFLDEDRRLPIVGIRTFEVRFRTLSPGTHDEQ